MATTNDDTIFGGFSVDSINGLAGTDLLDLDYSGLLGGLAATRIYFSNLDSDNTSNSYKETVYFSNGTVQSFHVISFEQFRIIATSGNDYIQGRDLSDTFYGGDGNDTLQGQLGDDSLYGGAGVDKLYGGAGMDALYGGDGGDTLFGGGGGDTLLAGAGDDVLDFGGTTGTADGGTGFDRLTIDLSGQFLAVTADLTAQTIASGGGVALDWSNIEAVAATFTQGDDHVTGGLVTEDMDGHSGADFLSFDFSGSWNGTTVSRIYFSNLDSDSTSSSYRDTIYLADGTVRSFHINNFEQFRLVGSVGNDYVEGRDLADVFFGEGGNDTLKGAIGNDDLFGGDGTDSLYGGAGDDRLFGGAGGNLMNGGDGEDVANYNGATEGAIASLASPGANSGAAAGDDYVSIENLVGTGFGDVLSGDDLVNRLVSLGGGDVIYGAGGADVINGGGGNDTLYGGGDDDIVVGQTGLDVLYGGAGADTIYGGQKGDALYGDEGDDTLYGGSGEDKLFGGAGADLLNGGGGADSADYSDGASGVVVYLDGSLANGGDALGDVFVSIENIVGSGFDDTIFGDGVANKIVSLGGSDEIFGGGGDDVLNGGSGDDSVYGGLGSDVLVGDAGADLLFGGDGGDVLYGGADDDVLTGGAGKDWLFGGLGADRFEFLDAADSAVGTLRDVIKGFDASAGDLVDLSAIDAAVSLGGDQAFVFLGSAAFGSVEGELRFVATATTGFLSGDTDGDGLADFTIEFAGVVALGGAEMIL